MKRVVSPEDVDEFLGCFRDNPKKLYEYMQDITSVYFDWFETTRDYEELSLMIDIIAGIPSVNDITLDRICRFSDDQNLSIAEALVKNSNLQSIDLHSNLSDENQALKMAAILAEAPNLRSIGFEIIGIEDTKRVVKMIEALNTLPNLRKIDLNNNLLTEDFLPEVTEAIASIPSLQVLRFVDNHLNRERTGFLKAVKVFVAIPTLRVIELNDESLGGCALEIVDELINSPSLRKVSIPKSKFQYQTPTGSEREMAEARTVIEEKFKAHNAPIVKANELMRQNVIIILQNNNAAWQAWREDIDDHSVNLDLASLSRDILCSIVRVALEEHVIDFNVYESL